MAALGFFQKIAQALRITDANPSRALKSSGEYDKTKLIEMDLRIHEADPIADTVSLGKVSTIKGAGLAHTWHIQRIGPAAGAGAGLGVLYRHDGAAFAAATLPAVANVGAGVIAICSDGIRVSNHDASAWVAMGNVV